MTWKRLNRFQVIAFLGVLSGVKATFSGINDDQHRLCPMHRIDGTSQREGARQFWG